VPRLFPGLRSKALTPTPIPAAPDFTVERKAVLDGYFNALAQHGGRISGFNKPWTLDRAIAEGYERIVWGFKAVQAISGASSSLQYRLRSGQDVVDDDPVCHLLNVQANPLETGWVFRKRLSSLVLLSKPGVFVEVGRSNRGTPIRYDILPSGRVKIVPGSGDRLIDHYELWAAGRKVKDLAPEDVRWIRDPHPADPYSGITPLEAAGLSIELDYFARLYNVARLRNDGRPGGIVGVGGVDEDVDESILDAIERRFDRGPHNAGKLTAVAGQLSFVDLDGKSPRDMQYAELARNSKTEILVAFGVPESQIGNAADKTFANSEAEGLAYWSQTMRDHNKIVTTGFEVDSPPELRGFLDTSEIEFLQVPLRAKRQEALAEFEAGLRSIKSYADLAGYGDQVEDTAETRALYLPSGKTPIAAREADKEALGLSTSSSGPGGGPAAPDSAAPGEAPPGQAAAAALERVQGVQDGTQPAAQAALTRLAPTATTGPQRPLAGAAAAAVASARQRPALPAAPPAPAPASGGNVGASLFKSGTQGEAKVGPALRLVVDRRPARKAAGGWRESETDEAHAVAVEDALEAALAGLVDRWAERTAARLHEPKHRKGTRHFTPGYAVDTRVGTKALDAARIVDEDRFAAEAQAVVYPILAQAVQSSCAHLVEDLGITALAVTVTGAAPLTLAGTVGAAHALLTDDGEDHAPLSGWLWRTLKARVLAHVLDMVGTSAQHAAARLATTVNLVDQRGGTVAEIAGEVRQWGTLTAQWARGLAETAATGSIEGTRSETLAAVLPPDADVVRQWRARMDAVTRETHRKANGQKRGIGEAFEVGQALLLYPGDPAGPIGEVARCRCRLTIRSRSTGRFLPAAADTAPARAGA
jgi:HK97 family phage portal protein